MSERYTHRTLSKSDIHTQYTKLLLSFEVKFEQLQKISESNQWIANLKLRSIPSVEGGISFLQQIEVWRCNELRETGGGLFACSRLEKLTIENCPNLISIPSIGCLTRLKTLKLGPFSEELEEFAGLTAIYHLHSSLEELSLWGWEKLSSLPHQLQQLTTLKRLEIQLFSEVKAFPEWLGDISNLKTLKLGPFSEELEEFPNLNSILLFHSSLEKLTLYGWKKLSSLPHQLQQLTALEKLKIVNVGRVKAFSEWFGNLSSLRSLSIEDCENLEQVPRLSNLQSTSVSGCPRLKDF
ncbi:hypothetical protein PTKIN_Ptkin09bG0282500 [Pterospermum kingtungense]